MMKTLVVRFRGIGDVLISWFGLEALAKLGDVVYCTSPNVAKLFPCDWVEVIPYEWESHPLRTAPDLPRKVMDIPHDRLINLVNLVDFRDDIPDYDRVSRAWQFARLMDVKPSEWVRPIVLKTLEPFYSVPESPVVVCQVDATSPTRVWNHWPSLSKILMKQSVSIVWCGAQNVVAPKGVINFSGQTEISEWLNILWYADVIIGTCSAAVHVGARMPHTSVVALYGSTDYRLFTEFYKNVFPITNYSLKCAPCSDWQKSYDCYGHNHIPWCLNLLSPNHVAKTVIQLISENSVSTPYHNTESRGYPEAPVATGI